MFDDPVPKKVKIEPGDGLHPLPWPYSHGWKVGQLALHRRPGRS